MKNLVKYLERPGSEGGCLLAGWYQWADAGSISSGLPGYLIDYIETRRVAEILPDGFYLFQVPGMHHHLRPEVKLDDGYPVAMQQRNNDFFYAGDEHPGLYLFLGEEPHMNEQAYADAFLSFVQEMNIKRVVAVGGVYGSMPYERDRRVSCTYSLAYMHVPSIMASSLSLGMPLSPRMILPLIQGWARRCGSKPITVLGMN